MGWGREWHAQHATQGVGGVDSRSFWRRAGRKQVSCAVWPENELRAGRGEEELGCPEGFFLEEAGLEQGFEAWVRLEKKKANIRKEWSPEVVSLWITFPSGWNGSRVRKGCFVSKLVL